MAWGMGLASAEIPQVEKQAKATAIRAISMVPSGTAVVVTIEATGPLPLPSSGRADDPPRVFFDFPGVRLSAPAVTHGNDPRISRIRAAVHGVTPLVTRVVLEFARSQPFRLERNGNKVMVIVGEPNGKTETAVSPVPTLPEPPAAVQPPARPVTSEPAAAVPAMTPREPAVPPPAPPSMGAPPVAPAAPLPPPTDKVSDKTPPRVPTTGRASAPAAGPALPAKDLEKYRRQVSPALDRLRLQQPMLRSLDVSEAQTIDRVHLAEAEFERLREELVGIKPPDTLRSQHDMVFQAATLALMATQLRIEAFRTSDPATLRNAASAAAGATLLLDRACAELGCPDSGR